MSCVCFQDVLLHLKKVYGNWCGYHRVCPCVTVLASTGLGGTGVQRLTLESITSERLILVNVWFSQSFGKADSTYTYVERKGISFATCLLFINVFEHFTSIGWNGKWSSLK